MLGGIYGDRVSQVVYVLGAGFNCSVLDPRLRNLRAPLARNFFQVMLGPGRLREKLDGIRRHVYVDELFAMVDRYWHLTLDDLDTAPFDIEECLTLLESIEMEKRGTEEGLRALRAAYAMRALLLDYLSEMSMGGATTPTGHRFGMEVLGADSDVLTFNYDTLAEDAIASASGVGPSPTPPPMSMEHSGESVPDEYLGASHLAWKRTLACGFEFDEVALPVAGVPRYVVGERYYRHPENYLYTSRRVLKLHGSIDWLRYTPRRAIPPEFTPDAPENPPKGLVQERYAHWWMGEPPQRDHWYMDPLIVTPQLYKKYDEGPLPTVWGHALDTLSNCRVLAVIGYSFPPTDFRTRRLFLEAFSCGGQIETLVVINPDTSVVAKVRDLTRYKGPVVTCDNLADYFGLPTSWFDLTQHSAQQPQPEEPP